VPFKVVPVAGFDDIVGANDNFVQSRNEVPCSPYFFGRVMVMGVDKVNSVD